MWYLILVLNGGGASYGGWQSINTMTVVPAGFKKLHMCVAAGNAWLAGIGRSEYRYGQATCVEVR